MSLGETLLTPTCIYVKPVLAVLKAAEVHGISHITGGGFYENIPRSVPEGLCAFVEKAVVRTPAIFGMIQKIGNIPERDMFNTFNMGVGMSLIVSRDSADRAVETLVSHGVDAYPIGEIRKGEEKLCIL